MSHPCYIIFHFLFCFTNPKQWPFFIIIILSQGDQASIIGGAINFVKELEQHLQTLEATKQIRGSIENQPLENNESSGPPASPVLFGDFFTFPQYSTRSSSNASELENSGHHRLAALAEIEVTMAESHANMKILSKKRPRQLLKLVAGLQCLWLTILHLNVTTVDQMVLYSLSVKVIYFSNFFFFHLFIFFFLDLIFFFLVLKIMSSLRKGAS